ncbi:dipeptide ABC transporter ATP-binding protein [Sphingosinicella sp.]|uniref:ABC transporter ATP-binding protein n=1 Tax=Sphingosinicella sp. TaxID=1917971 RepID=UPI0035AE6774
MSSLLKVAGLSVAFEGAKKVVDSVSFEVERGEIVALVGESGSGKTLAARSLMGLLPFGAEIVGGEALFSGVDLLRASETDRLAIRGARIGMIFQEPMTSLNPSMRIGDQMAEALKHHAGVSETEARTLCIEMLSRVRIANPKWVLDRYPHQFSGGMRQRIMIASVMLLKPTLVLADEPTTALDVLVQKEVLDLIVELAREAGSGVLLITHDLGLVAQYSHRIYVMRRGRVVEEGASASLLSAPKEDYTRTLLGALPRRGKNRNVDKSDNILMSADDISVRFPGKRSLPWRKTEDVRPLNGVSMCIRRGETVAIVGESGSGKTTLARALLGLVPITSGTVYFDGIEISSLRLEELRDARRRIRIVFQDPFSALDPRMRIGAIVMEGLRHSYDLSARERAQRVSRTLDEVGLGEGFASRFPHQLSGGQRQRVNIARALVADPDLIVADEPVSALDVTVQAEILNLLARLQSDRGFGCIFISHALGVVEQVADRVMVLYRGNIVETGSRDDIFDRPRHPYTCALLRAAPRLNGDRANGYRLHPFPANQPPPPPGHDYAQLEGAAMSMGRLVEVSPGHSVACTSNGF